MTGIRISELPEVVEVNDQAVLEVVVDGQNGKMTVGLLRETVSAGVDASTAEATTQALLAAASAGSAATAQEAAEAARDAAQLSSGVFPTTSAGLAATSNGKYFSVPSAEANEYLILYQNSSGTAVEIKRYYSTNAVQPDPLPGGHVLSFRDMNDNMALGITPDGEVEIPRIRVTGGSLVDVQLDRATMAGGMTEEIDSPGLAWAIVDPSGNVALGVSDKGELVLPGFESGAAWKTLEIGGDDSIVHIGDSYTAAHYVLKDKGYISQLSALSPYRHANFGISGNDALDMNYRIVNQTPYADGRKFSDVNARYAFITTFANDAQFRAADMTYYRENLHRLVETVQASGVEPIITTEFGMGLPDYLLLRGVAERYGLGFVDCNSADAEVGGLDIGPFHQGHPGTRTGGVFWLPMLNFIDRMPRPESSIKVFRRRPTFAVTTISDLLYKGRIDRNKRWKELTLSHFRLTNPQYFEELNGPNVGVFTQELDEYRRLETAQSVSFADYALIEVVLPGTAATLDAVELSLASTAAPTVYVRDYLDAAATPLGRAQGNTPTNADYLAKWDKPRGTWRSLGSYGAPLVLPKSDLARSMCGDTLIVMVEKSGGFDLSGLTVRYQGPGGKRDVREPSYTALRDPELLTTQVCGTPDQLAAWTVTGIPATVVPVDVSNAPRNVVGTGPVDGVCTVTSTDMIGQTVTVPSSATAKRRYRLTVWARYFPKAFLDPTLYPGLDASQIIDRIASPNGAPITPDSSDLRTLKCEVWTGSYPAAGGAEFTDFAALFWRPVEFLIEVPHLSVGSFSFRLSCVDGEVQVAKVSVREVMQ